MTLLIEPPDDWTRDAFEAALREAEALPDSDPDKAQLVEHRRRQLWMYFDRPRPSPQERQAALRKFLPNAAE